MIVSLKIRAALILLVASVAASAQTAAPLPAQAAAPSQHKPKPHKAFQPPYNPNVIVLDPAHGGTDDGARLDADTVEKEFNIAFAGRLKTLLEARGFNVVLTHTSGDDTLTADQRVELANRSRAIACLLLHATATGHGIHLYTSSLTAPYLSDASLSDTVVPWDTAQAASLARSLQLANELSTALNGLREPLISGRASVRPIDSMNCAAVAIELAPAAADKTLSDDDYEQHVAESIVTALTYWRQHAQAQIAAAQANFNAAQPTAPAAPAPKPKPKPKPILIHPPDESPLAPDDASPKPAPIERKPPAGTPPPVAQPPAGGAR